MLRVITDRQGDSYRLDLHGVLGGEWVPLLEQHWRSIMRALPSAKVTLVLSNVDFIDSDGERLLQRMADDGVEFVVAGCLNRYVIDNLKPGVRQVKEDGDEMSSRIRGCGRTRSGVTRTDARSLGGWRRAVRVAASARFFSG